MNRVLSVLFSGSYQGIGLNVCKYFDFSTVQNKRRFKLFKFSAVRIQSSTNSSQKEEAQENRIGTSSDGDIERAKSLSECQLDLMVSVKQLAVERVRSTREKSLHGLLSPAGLRVIEIILEEFMMDRVQTLRNASTAPSSVIDDLRACIEKSEVETKETNQDKIVIETNEGS